MMNMTHWLPAHRLQNADSQSELHKHSVAENPSFPAFGGSLQIFTDRKRTQIYQISFKL